MNDSSSHLSTRTEMITVIHDIDPLQFFSLIQEEVSPTVITTAPHACFVLIILQFEIETKYSIQHIHFFSEKKYCTCFHLPLLLVNLQRSRWGNITDSPQIKHIYRKRACPFLALPLPLPSKRHTYFSIQVAN